MTRRVVVCVTGSVAGIKVAELVTALQQCCEVKVVATSHGKVFLDKPPKGWTSPSYFQDSDDYSVRHPSASVHCLMCVHTAAILYVLAGYPPSGKPPCISELRWPKAHEFFFSQISFLRTMRLFAGSWNRTSAYTIDTMGRCFSVCASVSKFAGQVIFGSSG